jgi:chromate transporter
MRVNPLGMTACAGLAGLAFVAVALLRLPLVWVLVGLGALAWALAWKRLAGRVSLPRTEGR